MNPSLLDAKFLLLLVAVVVIRRFIPSRLTVTFGAVASSVLIGLASLETLIAIGGSVALYLFPLHRVNVHLKKKGDTEAVRRAVFILGTAGLVFLMVGFKVYQQFDLPFLENPYLGRNILSLFGFSYFLFRAMNFLYMQYVIDLEESSPAPILYYCLFPPTLTSGPIHKYLDFRSQIEQSSRLDCSVLFRGIYRITRGLFRKLCIAVLLNMAVTELLAEPHLVMWQSVTIIVALYLYFYYDFAGYSDIAIGFGLLLGISVPENFNRPFVASSLTEFWRNWHITLVDWFRDHVFIPLGGMRADRRKAGLLAAFVMLLCGLWHGLTIPFALWGLWHGGNMLLEALLRMQPVPRSQRAGLKYWSLVLWTNARVAVGVLLFLPDLDAALRVVRGLA